MGGMITPDALMKASALAGGIAQATGQSNANPAMAYLLKQKLDAQQQMDPMAQTALAQAALVASPGQLPGQPSTSVPTTPALAPGQYAPIADDSPDERRRGLYSRLLQSISRDPNFYARNYQFLQGLSGLAGAMFPDFKPLSPGSGLYNPATGNISAILDDPSALFKALPAGAALVDVRNPTSPLFKNPAVTKPVEQWETFQGQDGQLYRRNKTTGKVERVGGGMDSLTALLGGLAAGSGLQAPTAPSAAQPSTGATIPRRKADTTSTGNVKIDPLTLQYYQENRQKGMDPTEALQEAKKRARAAANSFPMP